MSDRRAGERRQQDARTIGLTDNLPIWARTVAVIGLPGAIAIALVWKLMTWGDIAITGAAGMKDIHDILASHIASQALMQVDQAQMKVQNDNILRVLRASCVNQAHDDISRERCVR